MNSYTLGFQEIDRTMLALVGGKGANLGELSRIEGIRVPEGFCVTTEAYKSVIEQTTEFDALLDQLTLLTATEVESVREVSKQIRDVIEATRIGKDIDEAVADQLARLEREMLTRCAPVQRRKICRQRLSQDSRIRI